MMENKIEINFDVLRKIMNSPIIGIIKTQSGGSVSISNRLLLRSNKMFVHYVSIYSVYGHDFKVEGRKEVGILYHDTGRLEIKTIAKWRKHIKDLIILDDENNI